MTMAFSLPAVIVGVVLVLGSLLWIGLRQRRQPESQKTSLPPSSIVPVVLLIVGAGLLALQIFSNDPFGQGR